MMAVSQVKRQGCSLVAAGLLALTLAGCGGGGSSGGSTPPPPPPPTSGIPPSSEFAGTLLKPNGGKDAADWDAASCTDARQKSWNRSNLNEDYLFYKEAPLASINPDTFTGTVPQLFEAYTTRALPQRDRFSFVITQAQAEAVFQSGTSTDLGLELRREAGTNLIRVAYTEPASAAGRAGIKRSGILATVNGTNSSTGLTQAQIDAVFASAPGTVVNVGIQATVGGPITNYALTSGTYASTPVLVDKVLPGTTVGYLAHTSFSTPVGETQLADAFKRFATAGVTDLVVDLRYNGGGYIFISAQLGYMVAGGSGAATNSKVFEQFTFNDKRSNENVAVPFFSTITNFLGNPRANEALSGLNLKRVFVLVSGSTCSASESFISSMRGIDVQTVLIGSTTCGKPYGFSQENNCTLSYFPIEFEGRNNKGEVFPGTGITPTCAVGDDLTKELGDPTEKMLAAALTYRTTGACPTVAAASGALSKPRALSEPNVDLEFVPQVKTIKLHKRGAQ
jgi:carboxyl-terminal processing protease